MVDTLLRNKQYNEERRVQDEWEKRDFDRSKMLADVHREAKRRIQEKIDRYYLSYADENGLSLAEGRKRIRDFDVPSWAKKAAEAVQFKDFSPETNKWLKTYNRKMYISRLELLKAEIDIELQNLYSTDHHLIDKHLEAEYLAELKRQAGILDVSSSGSSKRLRQVVDADFYGRGFSDNIWSRTGMYAIHKKKVFSALTRMHTDMTGYRNEMASLMKDFDVTEYEAMRLLRTESARMRATAQQDTLETNDFSHYRYVAERSACAVCAILDGHVFKVEDAEIGINLFPMHPNCRCSRYGIHELKRKDGTSNLDRYEVHENMDGYKQWFEREVEKEKARRRK